MKFDPSELENCEVLQPSMMTFGATVKRYHTPVSNRENFRLALQHKAEWMPVSVDKRWFTPRIVPDNIARAFVIEGDRYTGPVGGKDMFGIDWEYVPAAHGSIVHPGNPILTDITKWKEVIQFPDLDSWDWEGSAKACAEYLTNSDVYQNFCVFTGWFERLIAFMDFGPAAYAVMSRKLRPYAKEVFEALTDLWIDLVDHVDRYFGHMVDGFAFHDDWGSQTCPFFHARETEELLVPCMKRLTDHIHELGYSAELHSCGKIEPLIPCVIHAGWDSWEGMVINDYASLYEKYGDQLIMNIPAAAVPKDADEETLKAAADAFAAQYACKDRPACISAFTIPAGTTFMDELYKVTRMSFGE